MICDRCGQESDDGTSTGDFDGAEWICHACRSLEARATRLEQRRVRYSDTPPSTTVERLFPGDIAQELRVDRMVTRFFGGEE